MKLSPTAKRKATPEPQTHSAPVNEAFVEVLKQNVLKWEEAANAINQWMPKIAESDRIALADRGKQYARNARELKEFMEQLVLAKSTI